MNEDLEKLTLFLLGNCSVGKTAFINKYVNNKFEEYNATVGIDFFSKVTKLPTGEELKLLFYDTAGKEKYKAISFNLIKNAHGIILMYDISDRETFVDIGRWLESIKEEKGENFPLIIVGNKCDLTEVRQITKEEGEKLAKDNGFSFMETSCKDGINIEESVQMLVLNIMQGRKQKKLKEIENKNEIGNKRFTLTSEKHEMEKKKKKCC